MSKRKSMNVIKKLKISAKPLNESGVNTGSASSRKNLQDNLYLGALRKHDPKAIKAVNRESHKNRTASADVKYGSPYFYHPMFEPSTLILPTQFQEITDWCRYFYKYDALISAAIDAHSELPLSKIRLNTPKGKDKKKSKQILAFYEDMIGNNGIDLFKKLLEIGKEYYKVGNVFIWLQLDDKKKVWDMMVLLDPNSVDVELFQLSKGDIVELIPDDNLKKIIGNGPSHEQTACLYDSIPEEIIEYVQQHKQIPLSVDMNDGSHVVHLARKMSDFDVLGTSLIERNFKTLIYKDRLRQSQDAIAARHLMPTHVISTPHEAGEIDISDLRDQVDLAMQDPDYAIITNYAVQWDQIGADQGLMQLGSEWEWIENELMVGTMTNKQFLLGEGPFSGGETVLEILSQRYAVFREIMEAFIENHIFLPIAMLNDFSEKVQNIHGEEEIRYLYPSVRWNRINLYDDTADKNHLAQLFSDGKVDAHTWLERLGLDADEILERIEAEKDTVFDPTYSEMQSAIASAVAEALAPAIAAKKAKEMGIKILKNEGDDF